MNTRTFLEIKILPREVHGIFCAYVLEGWVSNKFTVFGGAMEFL